MPRKPLTHKRADVIAAIKLMESLGKVVSAVEFCPDGSFMVMTADHRDNSASAANEWDDV